MGKVPDKGSKAKKRDPKELHLEHAWLQAECPELFMLLSLPEIHGSPRQPSSIRLFVQDGRLKAAINDPTSEMVWFATLDGEISPLDALERHFAADQGEWREQRSDAKKKF